MVNKLLKGIKHDQGKLRYDLLPAVAVSKIVEIFGFGANKYGDYNWAKGINFSRVYAALQRHINAWWNREENDPETLLSHLAHAGCCLFFLLHYSLYYKIYERFDDRPKYDMDLKIYKQLEVKHEQI